ncbi:MAG: AMP-binding protein, partial [Acidimicrobiia bacterium]|nr:AMP-binding protein [Acidimicrobiia bacterium]
MTVSSTQLTPLLFLERTADVFGDKVGFVQGEQRTTYAEMAGHATRLAHAIKMSGIEPGDRVAYLSPNTLEMLIAHFAVPLAGAVLVAINTRLSRPEVLHILEHSGAKLLVVDESLLALVIDALEELESLGQIIVVPAPSSPDSDYRDFLATGTDDPLPWRVDDEASAISINYTSGTTGQPKGVVYTHRG